jgi:hypothetical protein
MVLSPESSKKITDFIKVPESNVSLQLVVTIDEAAPTDMINNFVSILHRALTKSFNSIMSEINGTPNSTENPIKDK